MTGLAEARRFRRAVGVVAVAVAAFAAWLHFGWGGDRVTLAVDDYGEAAAALVAAVACWRTGRASEHNRAGWLLLGASALAWALGELVFAHYEVVLEREAFPSLADVGFLAAIPLAVAGVLLWPSAPNKGSERLRSVLDGAVIATSLLVISWAAVLEELWNDSTDTWLEQSVGLAYPLGDVVVATIVLLALRRAAGGRRTVLSLVGLGLLAIAASDTAFAYFTNQDLSLADITGVGWFAGYLLIALAALHPQATAPAPPDDDDADVPLAAVLLPYAPLVLVVVVVAMTGVSLFAAWALGVLSHLIITRQLVTLLENRDLSHRLRVTLAEVRRQEVQLRHQAFHDFLTGLANRQLFWDRLEHALARRDRDPRGLAVVFLDLDRFKEINDRFGHAAGDDVLVAVAERLRACVRPGDTVARLGGDEFAVLVEDLDDREPDAVGERLREALATPFLALGNQVMVGASIGVAAGRRAGAEEMVAAADAAMYQAKAAGGDAVVLRVTLRV